MLCVLAREALAVATLHGAAQLSFRGYRVAATRLCVAGTDGAFVEITLAGSRGGEPLDRVRIAVAFRSDVGSACRIDPLDALPVAARQAESLRWLSQPG